jgi:hypothetical protein
MAFRRSRVRSASAPPIKSSTMTSHASRSRPIWVLSFSRRPISLNFLRLSDIGPYWGPLNTMKSETQDTQKEKWGTLLSGDRWRVEGDSMGELEVPADRLWGRRRSVR